MPVDEETADKLKVIRCSLECLIKREDGNDAEEIYKRVVKLFTERGSGNGFSPEDIKNEALDRFTIYIELKRKKSGPCNLFLGLLKSQIAKYANLNNGDSALDKIAEEIIYS